MLQWLGDTSANFVGALLTLPVIYYAARPLYNRLIVDNVHVSLLHAPVDLWGFEVRVEVRIANLSNQTIVEVVAAIHAESSVEPVEETKKPMDSRDVWDQIRPGDLEHSKPLLLYTQTDWVESADVEFQTLRGHRYRVDARHGGRPRRVRQTKRRRARNTIDITVSTKRP